MTSSIRAATDPASAAKWGNHMRHHRHRCTPARVGRALRLETLVLLLLMVAAKAAAAGGLFDLVWNTIDGGGATVSVAGDLTLGGTIGQPDAGAVSDGVFSVSGGFWLGGQSIVSTVDPVPGSTQGDGSSPVLRLLGSSPNPFRSVTTVEYEIPPDGAHVRIQVFEPTGRLVAVLVDDNRVAGRHRAVWSGEDARGRLVPSGVYFYRFEAGSRSEVRKLIRIE